MARKAKSIVNMPMTNMPVKPGSVTMPSSAMRSMMDASVTKKATGKAAGKKGKRSK